MFTSMKIKVQNQLSFISKLDILNDKMVYQRLA